MPRARNQRVQIDFEALEPGAKATVVIENYIPGYPVLRLKPVKRPRIKRPIIPKNKPDSLNSSVKASVAPQEPIKPMIPVGKDNTPFFYNTPQVSPIINEAPIDTTPIHPAIVVETEDADDYPKETN